MASSVPGPWVRRPTSVTVVIVLAVLSIVLVIPATVVALFLDLVTRSRRLRFTRVVALVAGLVLVDFAGMVLVALVWVLSPLGLRTRSASDQRRYRWVMTVWTTAIMRTIVRAVPLPFDTSELDESLLGGNAVVVARHQSLLDAVLPATLFGRRGLTVLYTLKEDLRWEPNIDIVGHRMGHRFVTRAPKDVDRELAPIRELAGRLDDSAVAVIFPEGTFFTQERKEKVVASLERRDPRRAAAAAAMQFLLAPRPGGTMALLDGAPDADVIVLGHVGFEPFPSLGRIVRNVGADHPVHLRAWRFPRHEVPEGDEERIDWLFERWLEMDEWVASHHPLRGAAPAHR